MKIIYRISGKISLLCYLFSLALIWHLCQYGGRRRHLLLLLPCLWIFAVSGILWLISRPHREKRSCSGTGKKVLFAAEAALCLLAAAFFGGRTVYLAVTHQGALSAKLEQLWQERSIPLVHDNFFEDGAEGLLEDLDAALELPEELYLSGRFQLTFGKDGTIKTIDTFLYGKDQEGETRTYLIDYDADEKETMTVYLDGQVSETCEEDMRLEPMIRILQEASVESPYEDLVEAWAETRGEETYGILYQGRRSFSSYEGLIFLSGDADGDGEDSTDGRITQLVSGGEILGYEVSLYIPEAEEVTPVRYIMEPEYRSQEVLDAEREQQQTETAKQSEIWTADRADGAMYYFGSDSLGWRLVVTDAAAGSRFYQLEKTEDGGISWKTENEDPFGGQIGVAEGLVFYDENFGIAGLANGSASASRLYLTRDGGATFTEITLPFDAVSELPESAAVSNYTAADYDYLCMPEKEGSVLTIRAVPEALEEEGILFQSEDNGATWNCAGLIS